MIEEFAEIFKFLEKYIEFPATNIPDMSKYQGSQIDYNSIEEVASILREHWNMGNGPAENLIDILQENGIIICKATFNNRKIDAFSQWYVSMFL